MSLILFISAFKAEPCFICLFNDTDFLYINKRFIFSHFPESYLL